MPIRKTHQIFSSINIRGIEVISNAKISTKKQRKTTFSKKSGIAIPVYFFASHKYYYRR